MGPLVAASRRNATIDFAGQGLADQQHASGKSSATPAGCAGNVGARLAGLSVACWAKRLQAARLPLQPENFFGDLEHPFWNFHYTLTSEPSPKKMALIGESRVADILANVLFPFWLAEDVDAWTEYAKLPAQLSNRRLETAGTRLFGTDPRRAQFLRTVAHQQGLLQIYEDFCMQDNSDCAQCPFPEQMAKWT